MLSVRTCYIYPFYAVLSPRRRINYCTERIALLAITVAHGVSIGCVLQSGCDGRA